MKVSRFYFPGINPIYRDLVIVLVTGMLASVVLVTLAFMIFRPG